MLVAALPTSWRQRATALERYAPIAAQAFRDAADELEHVLQGAEDSVTLKEASALGGYSVDALQHMVAGQRIENIGRKGKPRIRRSQVPVKPGFTTPLSVSLGASYVDVTAAVASVIAQRD